MNRYRQLVKESLSKLGISKGNNVLLHSSLNSIGRFENRAEIFIDTFLEVLGPEGTLLLPSLSYEYVTRTNPHFDIKKTPSCVGGLTEYFRQRSDSQRSLHPTHSVCAIGKNAHHFIHDHHLDNTPCGRHSPFRLLKEANGYVMFLGCGLKPNTSMHGIEELLEPIYLFSHNIEYSLTLADSTTIKKKYIPHNFKGYEQRYDRLLDILKSDDYSYNKVLTADTYLIKSKPMWEKAFGKLTQNSLYFVDKNK
jgi:aminoglycoside 3-N-acetyltransferase